MRKLLTTSLILFISNVFAQNVNEIIKTKDEYRNKGYFNITKIGYVAIHNLKREIFIPGEGNFYSEPDASDTYVWSLQSINGYFVSPYLSLGIGVGLDGHHKPTYNSLPVFIDLRAYLSDEEDSFYSFLDIGSTLRIGEDTSQLRKGVLINLGLGCKYKVSNRLYLISDLFFSHKTVSLTDEGIKTSNDIIRANGIGLSLGIIF
jgi:hypothetical protein